LRAGDRVELERAGEVVAVLHQPEDVPLRGRTAHEMIAILKSREEQGHSPALMDEVFAADVREGHELMNRDGKRDIVALIRAYEAKHGPLLGDEAFADDLEAHRSMNQPLDTSKWD
jgi:hypothetical protein